MGTRALLLALPTLLGACSGNAPGTASTDLAAVRLLSGSEVTVSPAMKRCDTDSACTLVRTGCDACCQEQAVNRASVSRYRAEFEEACAGYSGAECDCSPAVREARCVDRTCEAVSVIVPPPPPPPLPPPPPVDSVGGTSSPAR